MLSKESGGAGEEFSYIIANLGSGPARSHEVIGMDCWYKIMCCLSAEYSLLSVRGGVYFVLEEKISMAFCVIRYGFI